MTNFFFDNRGKISVVRTSLFFAGLGLLFVLSSFAFVAIERETSRSPLHIAIPEGAQEWSIQPSASQPYQLAFYKVPTTDVESVINHYQQQAEQAGSAPCIRFPLIGDFPDHDPAEGTVPYRWECLFERANVPGVSQTTQVTIHPGIPDEDPFLNTEGSTVIIYEQRWTN